MTQYITPVELVGLDEQQLRALYGHLVSDLRRQGQSAQQCPEIFASLQNVEAALVRLQQRPRPRAPKGPGF